MNRPLDPLTTIAEVLKRSLGNQQQDFGNLKHEYTEPNRQEGPAERRKLVAAAQSNI